MTFDELLNLVSSKNEPGSQMRNNAFGVPPCLCLDSRLVKDGDVFVAVEGTIYDGHDFIGQAVANGAKYIVTQQPYHCKDAEVIIVADSARAAALLAQASRGNPASQLTNLAVTGTNGKTTVAYLVRSIIQNADEKCGLVGTIVYDTGAASFEAALTTPDCLTIAERQSQMLIAGSKYMVIEASSHALHQKRLAGINFKAAAFTNLASDHLDYHKTQAHYLTAKTKLFKALSPEATAVLNKQSPHALELAGKTKAKILWYAIEKCADLTAHIETMDINGTISANGKDGGTYAGASGGSILIKTDILEGAGTISADGGGAASCSGFTAVRPEANTCGASLRACASHGGAAAPGGGCGCTARISVRSASTGRRIAPPSASATRH